MKWKLTLRYLLSTVIVAMIVVQLNVIIALGLFYAVSLDSYKGESSIFTSLDQTVRSFEKNIAIESKGIDNIYINEEGKSILNNLNSWIQILDHNGKVVYQYNTPNGIREKYSPIQVINTYKYSGVEGNDSTVLASEKVLNKEVYTYLIGLPMNKVSKINMSYESNSVGVFISKFMIAIIIVDIIVATIIGYVFSKSLTKPVKSIINGVEDLSDGNYEIYHKEKGIYKPVFNKLNNLSDTLKENEIERKNIESMRNEWIANISHDIKTPLASIKGYAELMSSDYDIEVDEVSQYAQIIGNKSNYIKELVDDLNLTMKLKSNHYNVLCKKEVNIVGLVRNCIIDILNNPNYSNVDINFESIKENINISIDNTLIRRVINNVLYNAIIHNDENIDINVNILLDNKVHIVIEDNGKGISKKDLKYIFERYYRGTNTGKSHKGSGLGMAIARDIIKAHDGDIKINSELGKGTKIEITI